MGSITRAGLAAVAALLVMSAAAPVSAASSARTTRWVDDDGKAGPTNCAGRRTTTRSIQSAVNRSDKNDVVIVCPGTYSGRVRITGRSRNGMTLRAYSTGSAILRAPSSQTEGPLMWVEGITDLTVQGLSLSFASTGCAPHVADVNGLFARDADGLHVLNDVIRATGSETQGACGFNDGIRVLSSTRVVVAGNTVRDFKSDGISFEMGSRGRIASNTIQFYHGASGSDDDGDQGIRLLSASRAEVTGNLVRSLAGPGHPKLEIGITTQTGASGYIHHNRVWYTKVGVGVIASGSEVVSNDVRGVGLEYGIHVLEGSGTEVRSNRVQGYDTGIYVEAGGTEIRNNDARDNVTRGCDDVTSGSGSYGTANLWSSSNQGSPVSSPEGICPAA